MKERRQRVSAGAVLTMAAAMLTAAPAQVRPPHIAAVRPTTDATVGSAEAGSVLGRLIRVPEDVTTLPMAIDAAGPGDVILLAAGTYDGGIVIPEAKHDITIRGVDRSNVVFDGRGFNLNAIEVEADRVTLENLSAHDFDGNGFYWEKVDGFTGRYLTVWNVNLYGIYATESRHGTFEHSLVSGAADAAFYVGECQPCDTIVRNVEGRLSAIGYSGTNTGAGLQLINSKWDRNGTGILPNSYEDQALPPPESESLIDGNTVRESGSVAVPAHTPLAGFIGIGIGVAGGTANTISNNTITRSDRYGIALFPTIQRSGATYAASTNRVVGNTVTGSGKADIALAPMLGDGGEPNCFKGNTFVSSLPIDIASVQACEGAVGVQGDPSVGDDLSIPISDALDRLVAAGPRPDYRTMPTPEALPGSPDSLPVGLRPFRSDASGPISLVGLAVVLAAGAIILFAARHRRRAGYRAR